MAAQFIITMHKLSRFIPPDRDVLKDINLSMYPGAKIGVIGANGSGKSTLLKIMAGLDDGYTGEVRLTPGFTVGYLAQEPQLDESKTVVENITDGLGEVAGWLTRYQEVCNAMQISIHFCLSKRTCKTKLIVPMVGILNVLLK